MRLNPFSRVSRKRRAQHRAQYASPSAHNNIIQKFIDELDAKVYLEIGYFKGGNFVCIRCNTKYAVDPAPYNSAYRRHSRARKLRGRTTEYFCIPSDDFFRDHKALLQKRPLDVVYVDGLHTFEQALRDVINAFEFLSPGGVVVLDDCNPSNETIGLRATSIDDAGRLAQQLHAEGKLHEQWDNRWCGDVWKAIDYLRRNCDSLNVSVLDTTNGFGVVSVKPNARFVAPTADLAAHQALPYSHLANDRRKVLNLQPLANLDEVVRLHCGK